jgi:hypothetical protein
LDWIGLYWTLQDLEAYTDYTLVVESVNGGGRANSPVLPFKSAAAAPSGVGGPTVTALSPSSALIGWVAPSPVTGVLAKYTVTRDGETVVCCADADVLAFTDRGLRPYTTYSYTVSASVAAGSGDGMLAGAASAPVKVRTLQALPGAVAAPKLASSSVNDGDGDGDSGSRPGGSTSMTVMWSAPSAPNGVLTKYTYLVTDRLGAAVQGPSPVAADQPKVAAVGGLSPYTHYNVTVTAFTAIGAGPSSRALTARQYLLPDFAVSA